jgi:hypothetical protein
MTRVNDSNTGCHARSENSTTTSMSSGRRARMLTVTAGRCR